ncbi:MAG: nucleotide exchange factor GrpE [Lachnospiraceae bacterium]|nr:nucleotide exchange factor GrpE [Lachnospiraceae bacterium]
MEEERKDLQENTSEDSDMVKEQESCAEQEAQENAEQEAAEEVPAEEDSAEETAVQEPSQEDPAQDEEECSGKEGKADKKLFKKKPKADKKQEALREKIEELEDKVKRQMAEFDNFRKRTEKEKSAMFETGAKSVIEKMLPVVDNFERGLAAIPEQEKGSPFAEGMEMIYKQILTEFEKMDVKAIPAVGEEFNPEFHNAVMQVESEEFESGIVAQELQKGYTYRDSVVRHSMVAVVS